MNRESWHVLSDTILLNLTWTHGSQTSPLFYYFTASAQPSFGYFISSFRSLLTVYEGKKTWVNGKSDFFSMSSVAVFFFILWLHLLACSPEEFSWMRPQLQVLSPGPYQSQGHPALAALRSSLAVGANWEGLRCTDADALQRSSPSKSMRVRVGIGGGTWIYACIHAK